MRSRIRCSKNRRMSSGFGPPLGAAGAPELPELLLDEESEEREDDPDERVVLIFTRGISEPSAFCNTDELTLSSGITRTVRRASSAALSIDSTSAVTSRNVPSLAETIR